MVLSTWYTKPSLTFSLFPSKIQIYRFLVAWRVKNLPAMWEMQLQPLGQEDPLEKGMATHSRILAWEIP